MAEPYYLTTAIHYPNGKPHIGHAYETIAADVIARFQRLQGREVRFQTGTDEHGLKMAQKARDLGVTPRELADEMSGHFRELFDVLNISYDRFIRTTDADHHRASQAIWKVRCAHLLPPGWMGCLATTRISQQRQYGDSREAGLIFRRRLLGPIHRHQS